MTDPHALDKIKTMTVSSVKPAKSTPSLESKSKTTVTASNVKAQVSGQKYEFYTLLPGMEVQLPEPTKQTVSTVSPKKNARKC